MKHAHLVQIVTEYDTQQGTKMYLKDRELELPYQRHCGVRGVSCELLLVQRGQSTVLYNPTIKFSDASYLPTPLFIHVFPQDFEGINLKAAFLEMPFCSSRFHKCSQHFHQKIYTINFRKLSRPYKIEPLNFNITFFF